MREKSKEHLIDRDSKSKTGSLHQAAEHRLEDDASLKQPSPKPEHAIIECTDGTTSPSPSPAQAQVILRSVDEILEHRLEDHSRQEQPTLRLEHLIIECTDGTISPAPGSTEEK